MGHGITNSAARNSKTSVTFITVLLVMLPGLPMRCYSEAQDGHKAGQEQLTQPGGTGQAQRLTVMILMISIGLGRALIMQNARAFKKRYLLLMLLVAALFGAYRMWHFSPLKQELVRKEKVNNLANLYITQVSAGATTGFSYRFYLYDASKDDNAFMASLNDDDNAPFIITTDKEALKKISNNAVFLAVKGTVYAFHSPADYRAGGAIYSVPVYLSSSPF